MPVVHTTQGPAGPGAATDTIVLCAAHSQHTGKQWFCWAQSRWAGCLHVLLTLKKWPHLHFCDVTQSACALTSALSSVFIKYSFLNSMSPHHGALTTCAQESLPSGKGFRTFLLHFKLHNTSTILTLFVTAKEQKGSMSSIGVNSPPRTMLPWRSGDPAQGGYSVGFQALIRFSRTAIVSSATSWSRTRTCSTCWVPSLTLRWFVHSHAHKCVQRLSPHITENFQVWILRTLSLNKKQTSLRIQTASKEESGSLAFKVRTDLICVSIDLYFTLINLHYVEIHFFKMVFCHWFSFSIIPV